nr:unnamed protein product [Digitaria exilis]
MSIVTCRLIGAGVLGKDMVTGFRIHGKGWNSISCTTEAVDAFRGTAPISLTERLYQIVRWAGGSVEMFFSHNNPLFAGPRLHPMQRTVYLNCNIYPVTSLSGDMWLIPEEILIPRPFTRYVIYLIVIIALIHHAIGLVEIRWTGTRGMRLWAWCSTCGSWFFSSHLLWRS